MTEANEKQGCLSVLFPFLNRSQEETTSEELPYRLRDDFLSDRRNSHFTKSFHQWLEPQLRFNPKSDWRMFSLWLVQMKTAATSAKFHKSI